MRRGVQYTVKDDKSCLLVKLILLFASLGDFNNGNKALGQTKTTAAPVVGTADELEKYKKLLDEGTITEEEYTAKKKQLLGL